MCVAVVVVVAGMCAGKKEGGISYDGFLHLR